MTHWACKAANNTLILHKCKGFPDLSWVKMALCSCTTADDTLHMHNCIWHTVHAQLQMTHWTCTVEDDWIKYTTDYGIIIIHNFRWHTDHARLKMAHCSCTTAENKLIMAQVHNTTLWNVHSWGKCEQLSKAHNVKVWTLYQAHTCVHKQCSLL